MRGKASCGTDFLNSSDWGGGGVKHPRLAVKAAALSESLRQGLTFPVCHRIPSPSHEAGPEQVLSKFYTAATSFHSSLTFPYSWSRKPLPGKDLKSYCSIEKRHERKILTPFSAPTEINLKTSLMDFYKTTKNSPWFLGEETAGPAH